MQRLLLTIIAGFGLCGLVAVGPLGAQEKRQQAWDLLCKAAELTKARDYAAAERQVLAARELDPAYPDVYANLGALYALWGDKGKALEAYGQLLTLKPDSDFGRRAVKQLFHEGAFPRTVRAPYLAYSGIGCANDEVRLGEIPGGPVVRLTYTSSLLYHEKMGRGQGPVAIPVPVTGNSATCLVNRTCYGFVAAPESDRFGLTFALSFPSETLFPPPGRSLTPVSSKLVHLLLRFFTYQQAYLGLPRDFPADTVVNAYLCPQGPNGAETYKSALYFYDAGAERAAVEWARQAAHELGHLLLPAVGRFVRPEAFASGFLGERLLMQYLAQEAGLVAGDPWPSPAAQRAANALWPGEELQLARYLAQSCRTSLDYWLAAGPASPLGGEQGAGAEAGEDSMQYFVGFMLWTQAAFGTEAVREVLQTAPGSEPRHFVAALKTYLIRQAGKGPLTLSAASLNLAASKLATPPLEGALGRTQVQLAPGDSAALTVYLPAGAWRLSTAPAASGLSVTFDAKGPLPVEDGSVALGQLEGGWHNVVVQAGAKTAAFTLEKLVFRLDKEA